MNRLFFVVVVSLLFASCSSDPNKRSARQPNPSGCIRECEMKYGAYQDRYESCKDVCVKYAR